MLEPRHAGKAVAQVPIFSPAIIGTASHSVIVPVIASACKIPTEADEDCIIAVNTAPQTRLSSGLFRETLRIFV